MKDLNMTVDEQVRLMAKKIPSFKNRTFEALSASGIIWVDYANNELIKIIDNKTITIEPLQGFNWTK